MTLVLVPIYWDGGAEIPMSTQMWQWGARRCLPKNTSVCGVSWPRSRRNATYKKGARLTRSRPQVKYGFIAKHRTVWPTRTMCRLLGVSSSGFYDRLGRPISVRERENAQPLKAIKHSQEASDDTYGSPRVVRRYRRWFPCSENRVARLMRADGIKTRHKRRQAPGQLDSPVHAMAPNLLDRQFEATGPNQKSAADFT